MKIPIKRKNSILRRLYPKEIAGTVYEIDFEEIRKRGFKGIIFDIDNTLVGHDAPATQEAVELAAKLRGMGFELCIVSNNKESRVKPFADELGMDYVFDAGKPGKNGYLKAMDVMQTTVHTTVAIGDQLLTDIYGANRAGVHNIFVKQLFDKEPGKIVFKRKIEKVIMFFYRHEKG